MFPWQCFQPCAAGGFPRIRGDVPGTFDWHLRWILFSPHTRGCSRLRNALRGAPAVFPAYAGMFLTCCATLWTRASFPRIRGDVPPTSPWGLAPSQFSPHTRGCSPGRGFCHCDSMVFPAYAGMFLICSCHQQVRARFPRIRGDVPHMIAMADGVQPFSPHTRGCSVAGHRDLCV